MAVIVAFIILMYEGRDRHQVVEDKSCSFLFYMETPYREELYKSNFVRIMIAGSLNIYKKNINKKKADKDYGLRLDSLTKEEQKIMDLVSMFSLLPDIIDELEMIIEFLEVDKKKLPQLYGNEFDTQKYYKYHYDNFLIRVVTPLDVCGKLGIFLYELEVEDKKANAHKFYTHELIRDLPCAMALRNYSLFLQDVKRHRHTKVHKGENADNKFDKLIFYDELNKLIGINPDPHDKLLSKLNMRQIKEEVNNMREMVVRSIELIRIFCDAMADQLKLLTTRANVDIAPFG